MASHIPTVQAIYAAFGRGDVPGILRHLAPDIAWDQGWGIAPPPPLRVGRGHDTVTAFLSGLAAYEFLRFEPLNFLEGGNQVAVVIALDLQSRATCRRHAETEIHLWTFGADGRAMAMRHIVDPRGFAALD